MKVKNMHTLSTCKPFLHLIVLVTILVLIPSCNYRTLTGKTFVNYDVIPCTLVGCDCCNECGSNIDFIVGLDTIALFGKPNGHEIGCKGTECDVRDSTMHCEPFKIGKKYELKGKITKKKSKNDIQIYEVHSFKLLE